MCDELYAPAWLGILTYDATVLPLYLMSLFYRPFREITFFGLVASSPVYRDRVRVDPTIPRALRRQLTSKAPAVLAVSIAPAFHGTPSPHNTYTLQVVPTHPQHHTTLWAWTATAACTPCLSSWACCVGQRWIPGAGSSWQSGARLHGTIRPHYFPSWPTSRGTDS